MRLLLQEFYDTCDFAMGLISYILIMEKLFATKSIRIQSIEDIYEEDIY